MYIPPIVSESSARTGNQMMSAQDAMRLNEPRRTPEQIRASKQQARQMRGQQHAANFAANPQWNTKAPVNQRTRSMRDGGQNMMNNMLAMPPTAGVTGAPSATQPNVQMQGSMPMPPQGQTAMNPAPGQYSQWGNNPMPVMPPPPPGANMPPPAGQNPWTGFNPNEKNVYGGQQIAGATPSMGEYGAVQNYADQANQQARRYLDPQQAHQDRRLQQEMINKGIDPNSAQGQQMADQLRMQQADADQSAAFGALGFGQGIQNQMSQQELANQQLAGNMQQALWGNQLGASGQGLQYALGNRGMDIQQRGQDINRELGIGGLQNQRYATDLGHQLGMGQLDYQRGMGEHGQMMDLLGYDMGVRQYNDQQQMIQDALYNQQYGATPIPGFSATNPYSMIGQMLGAGDTKWWGGGGGVSFGL